MGFTKGKWITLGIGLLIALLLMVGLPLLSPQVRVLLIGNQEDSAIRLIRSNFNVHSARWSPDGRWIAFLEEESSEDHTTRQLLYIMQSPLGERRLIGKDVARRRFRQEISWSPDSATIAYVKEIKGKLSIVVVGVQGEEIAEFPDYWDDIMSSYCWHPDGGEIAYTRKDIIKKKVDVNGEPREKKLADINIWIASIKGKWEMPITHSPFVDCNPCWSRKNIIAFASNREGNFDIWGKTEGGMGELRRITSLPGDEKRPLFSPDGSHLAFEGRKNSLWIVPSDGGTAVRLVERRIYGGHYQFIDNLSLVYDSFCASTKTRNIWVVGVGRKPKRICGLYSLPITKRLGLAKNYEPDPHPKGGKILFTSNRSGKDEIYVIEIK